MSIPDEAKAVLDWWCPRVADLLGPALRGARLFGSIPLGGFEPLWSDIDVCALLAAPVTDEQAEAICGLHRRMEDRFLDGTRGAWRGSQFLEVAYVPESIAARPGAGARCLLVGTGGQSMEECDPVPGFERYMLAKYSLVLLGEPAPFVPDSRVAMARRQQWLPELLTRPAAELSPIMQSGLLQELARTILFFRDGRFLSKNAALETEIGAGDAFADAYRIALRTRRAGSARAHEVRDELVAAYDRVAEAARVRLEGLLAVTRMSNAIRPSTASRTPELERLLQSDRAFNYFIRLGIESEKPVFSEVFVEEGAADEVVGALFRRTSGTCQFHALDTADFAGFGGIVTKLAPDRIQGRPDVLTRLAPYCPPAEFQAAAWINRKCLADAVEDGDLDVRDLWIPDLPRVVDLYRLVFRGFSNLEHMRRKLETGRGRGYYLEDAAGRISCIVQTEFEEDGECAIVGVATHPDYQRQGLARALMEVAEARLEADGFREVYLQFDSEIAKRLYESMGYEPVGRVGYLNARR